LGSRPLPVCIDSPIESIDGNNQTCLLYIARLKCVSFVGRAGGKKASFCRPNILPPPPPHFAWLGCWHIDDRYPTYHSISGSRAHLFGSRHFVVNVGYTNEAIAGNGLGGTLVFSLLFLTGRFHACKTESNSTPASTHIPAPHPFLCHRSRFLCHIICASAQFPKFGITVVNKNQITPNETDQILGRPAPTFNATHCHRNESGKAAAMTLAGSFSKCSAV
jgi:hypothetical protein